MPTRFEPFINNHIYHIFNKTIDGMKILKSNDYCLELYNRLNYYKSTEAKVSFSKISELSLLNRELLEDMVSEKRHFKVRVLAYVFMPNHYHLLVEQLKEGGISNFMSNSINSFTRYYNTKNDRKGQLFLKDFKAVRILTDEQLIHVSRYIHLNPFTSGLVNRLEDLEKYFWSSYKTYQGDVNDDFVNSKLILNHFDNDKGKYKEFMQDRAEYQKILEEIKYYSS